MRQARLQGLAADRMISDSVDFFMSNVMENPTLFRFMSQSLTGGSRSMREAIRNELNFFATEMVMDLNRLRILTHIEAIDLDMIGHLVVQTVAGIATELLDLPPKSDNLVKAIRQRTIKEIRLIFLGAGIWRSIEIPPETSPEITTEKKSEVKPEEALTPEDSPSHPENDIEETVMDAKTKAAMKKKRASDAKAAAKAKANARSKQAAAAKAEAKAKTKAKAKAKAKTKTKRKA